MKKFIFGGAMLLVSTTGIQAQEHTVEDGLKATLGSAYLFRSDKERDLFRAGWPDVGFGDRVTTDSFGNFGAAGVIGSLSGIVGDHHFEVRGIFLANASERFSTTLDSSTSPNAPFAGWATINPGGIGINGANILDVAAERETSFHTLEANWTFAQEGRTSFFIGARGLIMDDKLTTTLSSGALVGIVATDVENRLFGLQIGTNFVVEPLSNEKFTLSGNARFGLYNNHSNSTLSENAALGGGSVSDHDNRLATVTELGIDGTYQINENFSVTAGYMAILASNITSSAATFNESSVGTVAALPLFIQPEADLVFYHGVKVKAVLKF